MDDLWRVGDCWKIRIFKMRKKLYTERLHRKYKYRIEAIKRSQRGGDIGVDRYNAIWITTYW